MSTLWEIMSNFYVVIWSGNYDTVEVKNVGC